MQRQSSRFLETTRRDGADLAVDEAMTRWLAFAALAGVACSGGEVAAPTIVQPESEIPVEGDASYAPLVCPRDLPNGCTTPAPSYATQIETIIHDRCFPCHDSTGEEGASHDLSTYAKVHAQFGSVLTQVYSCSMPPATAPQPTSDQRAALLAWLVCGAPDD
jgi:hypothetical protein